MDSSLSDNDFVDASEIGDSEGENANLYINRLMLSDFMESTPRKPTRCLISSGQSGMSPQLGLVTHECLIEAPLTPEKVKDTVCLSRLTANTGGTGSSVTQEVDRADSVMEGEERESDIRRTPHSFIVSPVGPSQPVGRGIRASCRQKTARIHVELAKSAKTQVELTKTAKTPVELTKTAKTQVELTKTAKTQVELTKTAKTLLEFTKRGCSSATRGIDTQRQDSRVTRSSSRAARVSGRAFSICSCGEQSRPIRTVRSYSEGTVSRNSQEDSKKQNCSGTGNRRTPDPLHKAPPKRVRNSLVVSDCGRKLSLSSIHRRNRYGETLLHVAVMTGDTQGVRDLLRVGPNINLTDYAGWTALHEAVVHGHYDISEDLIRAGALVNSSANNGVTPLHDAIRSGYLKIAELLLRCGADSLLTDEGGETAYDITTDASLLNLMEKQIPKNKRKAPSAPRGSQVSWNSTVGGTQHPGPSQSPGGTERKVRRLAVSDQTSIDQHSCTDKSRPAGSSMPLGDRNETRLPCTPKNTQASLKVIVGEGANDENADPHGLQTLDHVTAAFHHQHLEPLLSESRFPSNDKAVNDNRATDVSLQLDDMRSSTPAMKRSKLDQISVQTRLQKSIPKKVIKRSTNIFDLLLQSDPFDLDYTLAAQLANGHPTTGKQSALKSQSADFLLEEANNRGKKELLKQSETQETPDLGFSLGQEMNPTNSDDRYQPSTAEEEVNSVQILYPAALAPELNVVLKQNSTSGDKVTRSPGPELEPSLLDDTCTLTDENFAIGLGKSAVPLAIIVDVLNASTAGTSSDISLLNPNKEQSMRDFDDSCSVSLLQPCTDDRSHLNANPEASAIDHSNRTEPVEEQADTDEHLDSSNTSSPSLLARSIVPRPTALQPSGDNQHTKSATVTDIISLNGGEDSFTLIDPEICTNVAGHKDDEDVVSSPDSDCTMISNLDHSESKLGEAEKAPVHADRTCGSDRDQAREVDNQTPMVEHVALEAIENHNEEQEKRDLVCSVIDDSISLLPTSDHQVRGDAKEDEPHVMTTTQSDAVAQISRSGQQKPCGKSRKPRFGMRQLSLKPANPWKSHHLNSRANSGTGCTDATCTSNSGLLHGTKLPLKNLQKRNRLGETQLHLACIKRKGDLSLVKALIEAGINVNQSDNAGWTALHEASAAGYREVVQELLLAGADVSCRGLEGLTPLHDAAAAGHYEVVKLLLQHGSNPNDKDALGHSALDVAQSGNIRELLSTFQGPFVVRKQPGGTQKGQASPGSCSVSECQSRNVKEGCESDRDRASESSDRERASQPNDIQPRQKDCTADTLNHSEAIISALEEVERKQAEMSTRPLTEPEDTGKFNVELSQTQSLLSDVLAKQQAEKDDLTRKYRIASDSFRQGMLRGQLSLLASRQKRLLGILQRQSELRQKLRTRSGPASTQSPGSQRRHQTESPSQASVTGGEWSRSLGSQYHGNSMSITSSCSQATGKPSKTGSTLVPTTTPPLTVPRPVTAVTLPQTVPRSVIMASMPQTLTKMVCTTTPPAQNIPSHVPTTSGSKTGSKFLLVQRTSSHLQAPGVHQTTQMVNTAQHGTAPNNVNYPSQGNRDNASTSGNTSVYRTSKPVKQIGNALMGLRYGESQRTNNASPGDGDDASAHAETVDQNRGLSSLIQRGLITPGEGALQVLWKGSCHQASLLPDGSIKDSKGKVFPAPEHWVESILGNNIPVGPTYAWEKVTYRQRSLSSYLLNMEPAAQPPKPVEYPQACSFSTQDDATLQALQHLMQIKTIQLVSDEEFAPNHIIDGYWDILVQGGGSEEWDF